jgi:hypothetical protein
VTRRDDKRSAGPYGTATVDSTDSSDPLRIPGLSPDVDTLTAALAYAAAGWYVLPVKRGSKKHPGSVVGERWHAKSTRDPQQIVAWFAGKDHGIALHCGRSGAVVFDVDNPDKVPGALRPHLVAAPYQSSRPDTPGRGHYVFAMPPGRTLGNSIGRLGGGWGEIRGLNGVIIAQPSHHKDGGEYAWQRVGPVPALPPGIAELLDDASPAEDAASDAVVAAFLAEHQGNAAPNKLQGLTKALRNKFDAGESRHVSTVAPLAGAMKEARAGYYPACVAVDTFRAMFLAEVAKPPASGKQGEPRTGTTARSEFDGILAWAVGQALAADLDEVRARVEAEMPDDHGWANVNDNSGHGSPQVERPTINGSTVTTDTAATVLAVPTTWEPFDLWPYLRGEIKLPVPTIGISRSDGLRLLYAAREHAVIGETESGKTWLALQCVAAELRAGHPVVYLHYEESNPASTVERLALLGVAPDTTAELLRFVAPSRALTDVGWMAALLRNPAPTLVVHDGVNEAMSLHNHDIATAEGAAQFRRCLVTPAIRVGAAVVSLDHLPKSRDGHSRDAYGSVHKGNALDGARIVLENAKPFGRGLRGASHVYVTKDRPGHLRAHGRASRGTPGKTYMGTLVADDESPFEPFSLTLYAPKDEDPDDADAGPAVQLADAVYETIAAQPDRTVPSMRELIRALRDAGRRVRDDAIREAVTALVDARRVVEVRGSHGARAYRAETTASREETP